MAEGLNKNLTFLRANIKDTRLLLLQGGTRSGKTYATLQFLVYLCTKFKGLTISICRETMPALRGTAMRDFFDILKGVGLYSEGNHSKSENTYLLQGNLIEFLNLDDEQKIRGRKRDILFLNEANEITTDVWRQLAFRTTGRIICDYNPTIGDDHWIVADALGREDSKLCVTTYKDNPHLNQYQVAEIERLQETDPEAWEVFGKGQRGDVMRGKVYRNWEIGWPDTDAGKVAWGLDFGFSSDPCALVECRIFPEAKEVYLKEHIYSAGLTNSDLAPLIKQAVPPEDTITADHSPDRIESLRRAGISIQPADKSPGSVEAGIDLMQSFRIFIHPESYNLQKEIRNYRWKVDRKGLQERKPVKYLDHALDAGRYAIKASELSAYIPIKTQTAKNDFVDPFLPAFGEMNFEL